MVTMTTGSPIIASRALQIEDDPSKEVILSIVAPEQVSPDEWKCGYRMVGLGKGELRYAHGSDSVQALVLAFEGLRVALADSGTNVSWVGGEPGDLGIPKFIPAIFGV